MPRKPPPARTVECPACGTVFTTRYQRKDFCTSLCHRRFHATQRVYYRNCKACGRLFTAGGFRWNMTACSEPCRKQLERESDRRSWAKHYESAKRHARTHSARRRARLRNAEVEAFTHEQVLTRDGWRCHLCGKAIPQAAKWPHPMSAALDHLVPLSQGGSHTLANVAASHAQCNQSKHNRPAGEQLRLIG